MDESGNVVRINDRVTIPLHEVTFRTARSSGPGGQNVNKLETKVELYFDVLNSASFSDVERARVLKALHTKIDSSGTLHLSAQASRSQWENKRAVLERFVVMLKSALIERKKRIATRPTKSAIERRLKRKKIDSEKKSRRKNSRGQFD